MKETCWPCNPSLPLALVHSRGIRNHHKMASPEADPFVEHEEFIENLDEYDAVYFDSDADDAKRAIPTNEDLLYDSEADETDEVWMKRKTENSDAVLSCPMCFAFLCFDCQRHERYATQFRAMFVENVVVSKEKLAPQDADDGEVYYPVACLECGTRVAVVDHEEVFHFFNVVES